MSKSRSKKPETSAALDRIAAALKASASGTKRLGLAGVVVTWGLEIVK
jgi:hypothetical protein